MAVVGINLLDAVKSPPADLVAKLSAYGSLNVSAASLPNPFIKVYDNPPIQQARGNGPQYGIQSLDVALISEILLGDILLPFPVVRVKLRNIVKTKPNAGGDFEINEIIGMGNSEVSIQGWIINTESRDYPFDGLDQQFKQIKGKTLDVTSELLRRYDIHRLVIKDADHNHQGGYENAFSYSINAISDNDQELELK